MSVVSTVPGMVVVLFTLLNAARLMAAPAAGTWLAAASSQPWGRVYWPSGVAASMVRGGT
jgi:hypothetical protein